MTAALGIGWIPSSSPTIDRLRNIVLRADVGITEEAWEVRESQQTRVRRLKVEKARTESRLQEELDEVLDDSGDADQETKNAQ